MAADDAILVLTNRRADDAAERIERIMRALNERIAALILDVDTHGIGEGDKRALEEARRKREQVIAIMRREGIGLVAEEAEEQAARIAAEIAGEVDFGDFSPSVARDIERIVRDQTRDIEAVFRAAAPSIRRAMDVASLTDGKALREATNEVARVLETTFSRASTAVETAIAGVSRTAVVEATNGAEDEIGEEMVFEYVGPADSANRDFCGRHVSRSGHRVVYTRAAFDALPNDDQDLGPNSVWGGGHGCRHALVPIPISDAIADGYEVRR